MKIVTLYTDGACSGNPGPGGWGAILEYNGVKKELSGGEANTTNNRMELTAVIKGLQALKEPCVVELYSDSKYVIDALEKGWAWGWKKKGWIKSDKKPALNPDLWEILLQLTMKHELHYHWVKGHAENPMNNRCDEMAVSEWKKIKEKDILKPERNKSDKKTDIIIEKVCLYYHVEITDIFSQKKTKNISEARKVATYFIRKYTDYSLPEIGRIFNRDHTTILYSINAVKDEIREDESLKNEIETIEKCILLWIG